MSELAQKESNGVLTVEPTWTDAVFTPRFDIVETESELLLYGDLPGVRPEDLDIRYENRELTIHGKVTLRERGTRRIYREYDVGSFHRSFALSEVLDAEQFRAELKNGVLVLHLPKTAEMTPRKIPVQR